MSGRRALDVGCGAAKHAACLGVDRLRLPGVDVVADLQRLPWPFRDGAFARIVFDHSLQYLGPFDAIMRELVRVAADGATVEVTAPHFSSYNTFSDPSFQYPMAWRSFDHYTDSPSFKYSYYGGGFRFEIVRRSISFRRCGHAAFNPWRWIGLEWCVNRWPQWYERFFAFVLPAQEICYTLKAHKPPAGPVERSAP